MNIDLASLLPKTPEEWVHFSIVGLLGLIAIVTALGVVVANSPVRSALCLVANFFCLAFLYFSLGAEMLGITQIVVYTGAIMVLFLFVIMLLNLSSDNILSDKRDLKVPLGILLGISLFALLGSQILTPFLSRTTPVAPDRSETVPHGWGSPQSLGYELFSGYVWPFEVISLLLMIGIVGAIVLARGRTKSA